MHHSERLRHELDVLRLADAMVPNDLSPLPNTEVHYLRSEHVGDEFKVIVGRSDPSMPASARVLFLGDTWANFGTAIEIVRLLRVFPSIEPLYVVGVGYRTTNMAEIETLRTRDFTPTVNNADPRDKSMMGGADHFLGFLRDELKPWIRERFDADTNDAAYFGDSLGGLFAAFVLFRQPDVFRRYGLGSAALNWDGGIVFEHEAAYAESHDDLPAKVFISVGAYESSEGDKRWFEQVPPEVKAKVQAEEGDIEYDYVRDAQRMVDALRRRGYPHLDIEHEVLPGEYHDTSPAVNLSRSIRYLFNAPL